MTRARWRRRSAKPSGAGAGSTRRSPSPGVIAGGVPAWQFPAEQEAALLDINLGGVLNLARAAVPALLRRPVPRRGRFIAVASAAATRGLPMLAAYCASKAGVAGFIRALAAELGGTGVTVNAVSPGSTATAVLDESARLYALPAAESFASQQPLGRLLRPEEVAAVIAFLAGDGASGMTGASSRSTAAWPCESRWPGAPAARGAETRARPDSGPVVAGAGLTGPGYEGGAGRGRPPLAPGFRTCPP